MVKQKTKSFRSVKSLIFYVGLMIWPVAQFLVFYIGVNANSFFLAFKNISLDGSFTWTFKNFSDWFSKGSALNDSLVSALGISLKTYIISLVTSVPLGLLFSYYIFKKFPGAIIFRFMLFMPSIIASIVLVTIFSYWSDYVLPGFVKIFGAEIKESIINTPGVRYGTIMFYNIFVGFGTTVLLYSNKMSGISPEIIEAAELDGAGPFKEFIYIVFPQAFSTVSVFLVTGITSIFTNEINNFSFFQYNMNKDTTTVGFLFYYKLQNAGKNSWLYPPVAALGLMCTAVTIPLTFFVKWLLNKIGPSED